jgi:alanyl-tRNA synthetase
MLMFLNLLQQYNFMSNSLTKDSLRQIFSKDPSKYYKVEFFVQEGFTRKRCPSCGKYFWSIDKETCGDSTCEKYSFFKKPPIKADYIEEWKKFENFFVSEGHTSIPRYPVICRWRDDLHFTIASIVDFMRLEKGVVSFEYPANPLVVPQPCLRFPDIESVGVTGRHMTSFIMAGQHSFGNEGYWKDRCLELNYKYLTQVLGVDKHDLTYVEDVWAMPDLSSFGPCMESFSGGLELVNSVFMQYRKTGENDFKELDLRVIDVGWGFDRLVWFKAGTPTAYDVAYGPVVNYMFSQSGVKYDYDLFSRYSELSGRLGDSSKEAGITYTIENLKKDLGIVQKELDEIIYPIQAHYAIADHTRTLLFAVADGGIPSNVGGGYNLRVILRRAFSFIDKYNLNLDLVDIAEKHASYLRPMFPELAESLEEYDAIIKVERERYNSTVTKARKIVADIVTKGPITKEKMMTLYESNGVSPELVREVGKELKVNIEIPEGFYEELTNRHIFAKEQKDKPIEIPALPQTVTLYYTENNLECTARVLYTKGNHLVLDQTVFYPESGGQVADHGVIMDSSGTEYHVVDAQKVKGVIIHILDKEPRLMEGDVVRCKVDKDRRRQLTQHHTSTHIIAAAARAVLGKHVWQAGAHKDVDKAHLDITHYERITQEQLDSIERIANEIVERSIPLDIKEMARGEAEAKYGFQLYQGGAPPGKIVRVVSIPGVDTELCGGTHLSNTAEAGLIKIIKEERIQDGVNRITFAAGRAALDYIKKQEKILNDLSSLLSVPKEELSSSVSRIFQEWKEKDKSISKLEEMIAEYLAKKQKPDQAVNEIEMSLQLPNDIIRTIANKVISLNPRSLLVLYNNEFIVVAAGKDSGYNANQVLQSIFQKKPGKGGGSALIATGKFINQ